MGIEPWMKEKAMLDMGSKKLATYYTRQEVKRLQRLRDVKSTIEASKKNNQREDIVFFKGDGEERKKKADAVTKFSVGSKDAFQNEVLNEMKTNDRMTNLILNSQAYPSDFKKQIALESNICYVRCEKVKKYFRFAEQQQYIASHECSSTLDDIRADTTTDDVKYKKPTKQNFDQFTMQEEVLKLPNIATGKEGKTYSKSTDQGGVICQLSQVRPLHFSEEQKGKIMIPPMSPTTGITRAPFGGNIAPFNQPEPIEKAIVSGLDGSATADISVRYKRVRNSCTKKKSLHELTHEHKTATKMLQELQRPSQHFDPLRIDVEMKDTIYTMQSSDIRERQQSLDSSKVLINQSNTEKHTGGESDIAVTKGRRTSNSFIPVNSSDYGEMRTEREIDCSFEFDTADYCVESKSKPVDRRQLFKAFQTACLAGHAELWFSSFFHVDSYNNAVSLFPITSEKQGSAGGLNSGIESHISESQEYIYSSTDYNRSKENESNAVMVDARIGSDDSYADDFE